MRRIVQMWKDIRKDVSSRLFGSEDAIAELEDVGGHAEAAAFRKDVRALAAYLATHPAAPSMSLSALHEWVSRPNYVPPPTATSERGKAVTRGLFGQPQGEADARSSVLRDQLSRQRPAGTTPTR